MFSGVSVFFFQAEDGIRDLVRSRGLGDVYKRQVHLLIQILQVFDATKGNSVFDNPLHVHHQSRCYHCLLYTSDAADERSSVDLGGRRIIKKKNTL